MSKMRGLQDDCWDQVCPFTGTDFSKLKQDKINCLHANSAQICQCCKSRNLPDCEVLYPSYGLVDICDPNWTQVVMGGSPSPPSPLNPPKPKPLTPPASHGFFSTEVGKVVLGSLIGLVFLVCVLVLTKMMSNSPKSSPGFRKFGSGPRGGMYGSRVSNFSHKY